MQWVCCLFYDLTLWSSLSGVSFWTSISTKIVAEMLRCHALWLAQRSRATFSANQNGTKPSRSFHSCVSPALGTFCLLVGSSSYCLCCDWSVLLGSFTKDDGDGNENGHQQLCTCSTLFLYIFWPQLHDHKRPSFTFYGGREVKKTTFFLFFELKRSSFEFISWKISQHLTYWAG